jgi:hypothetical protein
MKTILLLAALLAAAITSMASDVRLAWDASPDSGCNYSLYAHTNALDQANYQSAAVKVNVGTNLTAKISELKPGRWWFICTANLGGVESDISNVINAEVPRAPANMRMLIIQYSSTLTNGYTDVGFFKLRIE